MENYEQKYKEALSWAHSAIKAGADGMLKEDLERVFPELAESEDDRIRKEIIQSIKDNMSVIHKDKCLAWLEKQGEQNPVNKTETKFKVGDWCIDNEDGATFQIMKVLDNTYTYKTNEGDEYSCTHYSLENDSKLWTIQDAKDGDVLQLGKVTAIFQEYIGCGTCKCHCSVCNGEFEIPSQNDIDNSYGCYDAIPATKEQRDLLFQKMKEEGCEWNAEKKELKKIKKQGEQILANSEKLARMSRILLGVKRMKRC